MTNGPARCQSLEIMERKLFCYFTPWALLTSVLGVILVAKYLDWGAAWLQLKTALVLALVALHICCGQLMPISQGITNPHSQVGFCWFNKFPLLTLVASVLLVVFKPDW